MERQGLLCFPGQLIFYGCCKQSCEILNVWSFQQCKACTHSCGKYKMSRLWSFFFLFIFFSYENIVNVAASTVCSLRGAHLPHGGLFQQQVENSVRLLQFQFVVWSSSLLADDFCPLSFLTICSLSFEGSEHYPQFFQSWQRRCSVNIKTKNK